MAYSKKNTGKNIPIKGKLIVVEGIDGSGKSTQLRLLEKWLISKNMPVFFTEWNSSKTRSIPDLKKNKSNSSKVATLSPNEIRTDVRFKKVKKITKSIKRIESEMSQIQFQMTRIGKDLTTVLNLIETKKKN